jgi:hypothetical protein
VCQSEREEESEEKTVEVGRKEMNKDRTIMAGT